MNGAIVVVISFFVSSSQNTINMLCRMIVASNNLKMRLIDFGSSVTFIQIDLNQGKRPFKMSMQCSEWILNLASLVFNDSLSGSSNSPLAFLKDDTMYGLLANALSPMLHSICKK